MAVSVLMRFLICSYTFSVYVSFSVFSYLSLFLFSPCSGSVFTVTEIIQVQKVPGFHFHNYDIAEAYYVSGEYIYKKQIFLRSIFLFI